MSLAACWPSLAFAVPPSSHGALPALCACLSKSPLCKDSSETSSELVSSAMTLLPNRVTPKIWGLGLHGNLGRIQFTPSQLTRTWGPQHCRRGLASLVCCSPRCLSGPDQPRRRFRATWGGAPEQPGLCGERGGGFHALDPLSHSSSRAGPASCSQRPCLSPTWCPRGAHT